MKFCPSCENDYPDEILVCPLDGTPVRRPGSRPDPFVGRVIRGRYRVDRQLGEGGMGTVYLAEQLSIPRKVALKVLRAEFTRDADFVARFRQEARLVAALNEKRNPYVTLVYDFDQAEDGSLFIVMEWLEGQVLSEVIQRQRALELPRAVRLATQIADGLEAAHRAGIVHRDIKPSNIMVLATTDDIKLMDFGIARLRDSSARTQLTRAGTMMGTPDYMAPEQIEGGEVTPRIDIYSFGIVFYEMLTGEVPFRATTPGAVLAKHLHEAPVPPGRLRPEIPREVEALVLTALEKDPAHRQGSMGEIVHALRESARRLTELPKIERPVAPTLVASAAPPTIVDTVASPEQPRRASRRLSWLAGRRGYRAAMAAAGAALAILVIVSWPYFGVSSLRWLVPGSAGRTDGDAESAKRPPEPPLPEPAGQQRASVAPSGGGAAIPGPALSLGAFHALVVGNSDYTAFRRLRTAVNDAEAVAAVLRDRYGFAVKLLRNATRAQIMSELDRLRQQLAESDNFLIYYAGHCELDQESQRGYWLPVDAESESTASWIANSDVSELLNLMAVNRLLVVADSCYAAKLTRVTAARPERMTQEELARALQTPGTMRARMVMASGGREPVVDRRGGQHSVFAQMFLEVLEANDGVLPGRAVFQRIERRVQASPEQWTVTQRPEYGSIASDGRDGGDFFFLRTRG